MAVEVEMSPDLPSSNKRSREAGDEVQRAESLRASGIYASSNQKA